jgi:N-acetylglutamate synthase-like GNAT family acetyltransferase
MTTHIREYTEADKEPCLAAFKSNVPLYFTKDEINDFDNFLNRYMELSRDKTRDQKTFYYVIVDDDKIIGCGGYGDKENSNIITLTWGLIHRDFHKMGFGKILLTFRINSIKERFNNIPVFIDTTQHSYPFFEKFGFRTTQITPDYYTLGMDRYDMVLNGE